MQLQQRASFFVLFLKNLVDLRVYPVGRFVPPLQKFLLENLSDASRSPKLLHNGLCFLKLLLLHQVLDALQVRVEGLLQRRHGDLWQLLMSEKQQILINTHNEQ